MTGLCKLAILDKVKAQEYSISLGRYVGVVIEEDGKTEEELIKEILNLNDQFESLNSEAHDLEKIISENIKVLAGDL